MSYTPRLYSEKDIEKYLIKEVVKLNCLCLKFTSPGRTGVPDRLLLFPDGKHAFVELKKPGEEPTIRQMREMDSYLALGHLCFVVDSHEGVDQCVGFLANINHTQSVSVATKRFALSSWTWAWVRQFVSLLSSQKKWINVLHPVSASSHRPKSLMKSGKLKLKNGTILNILKSSRSEGRLRSATESCGEEVSMFT